MLRQNVIMPISCFLVLDLPSQATLVKSPPEFNIFYELNPIDYFKRTRAYDVNGAVWREIFRRDFIVKNNLKFNTDIKFSEDNLFMMEALSCCGKMIETKTICHHYVMHGDNTIKIVASSEWDKLIEMDLSRIKEIMKFYQSDKADLNNKGLTNAIEFTVFLYAFEALKKVLKSHGGRDEMKSVIDQLNNMGSYPLKRLSCFREYGMANVLKIRMEWSLLRHKYPALITASLTQLYNTLKKK